MTDLSSEISILAHKKGRQGVRMPKFIEDTKNNSKFTKSEKFDRKSLSLSVP